jgi:hypothetical protein
MGGADQGIREAAEEVSSVLKLYLTAENAEDAEK